MFRKSILLTAGFVAAATVALADGHAGPHAAAIKARQAQMTLYAFNLGILGGMAQEKMEYNADAAATAANNIVALTSLNLAAAYPQGSDSGSVEGTRAKADIWTNFPDVGSKAQAMAEAAAAMAAVAGTDLASLQGAMGALGQSCGGCHRGYREPEG